MVSGFPNGFRPASCRTSASKASSSSAGLARDGKIAPNCASWHWCREGMTMRSSGAAGYGLATANGIEIGATWPWAAIGLLSVALLLAAVAWVRQRRNLAYAEAELERLLAGNFQESSGTASDSSLLRL